MDVEVDQDESRRLLCNMSLGYTAYYVWAKQARRERRYNIARLFEASSCVKRIRAEQAFRDLGEVGPTQANLERALAGLEPESVATGPVTGTSAISRELLSRAAQALSESRDLKAEELQDLFVCGSCGELMEGAPSVCAVCGTVSEGFITFRAAESMGNLGPYNIVRRLEQTFKTLQGLTEHIDEELLALRPLHGYSIKELIAHLADMDVIFRERAWLILETDTPRLPSAHPPKLSRNDPARAQPIADLLDNFQHTRQQTLGLLRGLTMAAWHRVGFHEIFGSIPLTHQGNWVVEHERGHLIEMAQLRHDLLEHRAVEDLPVLPVTLRQEVLEGE